MTLLRFLVCASIGLVLTWFGWTSTNSPPTALSDWLFFLALSALTGILAFFAFFTRTWWFGGVARGDDVIEPRIGRSLSIRSAWRAVRAWFRTR